ncbi:MAG: BBP7 family outer membrane beta-barrel protein [Planctomycetes bacterium]|nr:BBP7 family outer membrane beta-barrel protein [Planctomycetota bacterium]
MPAPAAHQPGWGYAAPANYYYAQQPMMQATPAYFQEPVPSAEEEMPEPESLEEYYSDEYYPRHGHRMGSVLLGLLGMVAPYSEGGRCEPHWFDLHAEFLYLSLDNHGPFIEFSKEAGAIAPRISSNDLEYGDEPGFRVTGTYQTGPGSNLEFTYLGMFDFKQESSATGVDNLNSVFSDFTGPFGIDIQEQFDLADLHRVSLANNLDSMELNYRRRWVGPTCLLQGSWLVGVRYVKVKERLSFFSVADRPNPAGGRFGGTGTCIVDATNYMTGPQIGGDLWLCVLPGLNVGLDGKFALLGNNAKQFTSISGDDINTGFVGIVPDEVTGNDKVTFLGEASLNVTYRVNHKLTIRAGYELILLEGVALALENFNPEVPLFGFTRTPSFSDGGSLFYDGFTFGGELMW